MALNALIQFTQDITAGLAGQALKGVSGTPVSISNGSLTDIQSWKITLVYVPPNSKLVLGVLATGNTNNPTASFTPDVVGCYRIQLFIYNALDQTGGSDEDIRNFAVPDSNGIILPPYQQLPAKIPVTGTGADNEKPDELNFSGQAFGWAGAGSDGLMLDFMQQTSAAISEVGGGGAPLDRQLTAGDGLVGGGDLSADRTFDIGAAVDGSIVVNSDSIQVGTLASDDQHGNLGGGVLHSVVSDIANGFMSSAQKAALEDAIPSTRLISTTSPLSGGGDLSANRTLSVGAGTTSASGVVQLQDSTSSTSTTTAATPNSVKAAYDLANTANTTANAALPTAGGTMSGGIDMGTEDITNAGAIVADTVTASTYDAVLGSFAYDVAPTLDVSTNQSFTMSDTATGNMSITLNNGVDGQEGWIVIKNDTGTAIITVAAWTGRTLVAPSGTLASTLSDSGALLLIKYRLGTAATTAYALVDFQQYKT